MPMDKATQAQLLALNRDFYATIAEPFDATRMAPSAGKSELVRRLPLDQLLYPRVADIGCGNGRLAWLLDERGISLDYVGMDANAQLLALARSHTASLQHVRATFVQADLAQDDWPGRVLQGDAPRFDIVTCLATLHHLPGYDLRCHVMSQLAALAAPSGLVAISTWQFFTSPRFAAKVLKWAEVGIDANDVEPGDALLPWQQGQYAVRYVHQIDLDEVHALASAAGLQVEDIYFADGKEGTLNLYALMRRVPTLEEQGQSKRSIRRSVRFNIS
jgi:2-polyprenyl-3-methyl-5-hydroxy-6-metoxy-1,4-benzoquinol methylase